MRVHLRGWVLSRKGGLPSLARCLYVIYTRAPIWKLHAPHSSFRLVEFARFACPCVFLRICVCIWHVREKCACEYGCLCKDDVCTCTYSGVCINFECSLVIMLVYQYYHLLTPHIKGCTASVSKIIGIDRRRVFV